MRIKNFILVLIISIIISKNSFSENIEIQSSNMKISEEGNIITFDDQKRKLELVIETSNKIWGE